MAKQQAGLPMSPNDYIGPAQNVIPVKMIPREPTTNDKKYRVGQVFIIGDNPSSGSEGDIWYLARFDSNGDAIWSRFIGTDDYASTTAPGIIEIATDAEAVAGSSGLLAIVPSNIAPVLAEPPAIGGTTPAAITGTTGTFDEVVANDGFTVGNGGINRSISINGSPIEALIAAHTEGASELAGVLEARYTDTASFGAHLILVRSRGDEATPSVVQSGDIIGSICFGGYDGTDYALAAQINCDINGTPGSNDMPGRLSFKVSPDGSQSPANALVLDQDKSATFSGTVSISGQTENALPVFGASGLVDEVGPLTDGQILVGSTGSAPVAATITAGTGITVTNGAGSIEIEAQPPLSPGDSLVSARALSSPEYISEPGLYLKADYSQIGSLTALTTDAVSWSSVTSGFGSTLIRAVATDTAGVWIAVGDSGTMTRSSDNGATWSSVTSGFGSSAIYSVATDGSGVWVAVGASGTVTRSTDDGATWSSVTSGTAVTLEHVATDTSGVWVAGGASGVMIRSTDNGATWSSVTSGFGSTRILSITTDEAGLWVAGGQAGVATRSSDNGATWSVVSVGSSGNLNAIATDGAGLWLVGASSGLIHRSIDDGVSWSTVPSGTGLYQIVGISGGENNVWVAVAATGLMVRSTDRGVSWWAVASAFGTTDLSDVANDGSGVWVAGGASGTMTRSTDTDATQFYVNETHANKPLYLYTGETP